MKPQARVKNLTKDLRDGLVDVFGNEEALANQAAVCQTISDGAAMLGKIAMKPRRAQDDLQEVASLVFGIDVMTTFLAHNPLWGLPAVVDQFKQAADAVAARVVARAKK